jgi:hypothetical protein
MPGFTSAACPAITGTKRMVTDRLARANGRYGRADLSQLASCTREETPSLL